MLRRRALSLCVFVFVSLSSLLAAVSGGAVNRVQSLQTLWCFVDECRFMYDAKNTPLFELGEKRRTQRWKCLLAVEVARPERRKMHT